jgi:hypothetical protein
MSFENDIQSIMEMVNLNEGFARAKELYVDTGKMDIRQLKSLARKDPTEQKKYIEWMCKQFVGSPTHHPQKNTRQYDIMVEFDALLNKMEKRDINQYKNLEEVHDAVSDVKRVMFEEEQRKKEEKVRNTLVEYGGNVWGVYKYLNGFRLLRDAEGQVRVDVEGHAMVDETIPEYVTQEFVKDIRQRMMDEEAGIFGYTFTIDTGLLNMIDPADVVKQDSQMVIIVKPTTVEKSQLYGRWPPDWGNPNDLGAPWCTSYTTGNNQFHYYFGPGGGGCWFYIILPKDVSIVPEKKYAKINIQVAARKNSEDPRILTGWDFEDHRMSPEEIRKILTGWGIELSEKNTIIQ